MSKDVVEGFWDLLFGSYYHIVQACFVLLLLSKVASTTATKLLKYIYEQKYILWLTKMRRVSALAQGQTAQTRTANRSKTLSSLTEILLLSLSRTEFQKY